MAKQKIFVIIPAYNEEINIAKVIKDVKKFTRKIIVVDDGSTDKTADLARKTGVKVLRHLLNLGKGAALKTGCEEALKLGATALIFMDADNQHAASDLPLFKKKLKEKNALILGFREYRKKKFYTRLLGSTLASYLIKFLFGKRVYDPLCGFRAFSKDLYKKINWSSSGYGVELEITTKALKKGVKIYQIPVSTIYLDKYKGFTIIDGMRLLLDLIAWRFNFKEEK